MKSILIIAIILILNEGFASPEKDLSNHLLNHPELHINFYPVSYFREGYIYVEDVMEYVFKSEPERKLAIKRLSECGYGKGKQAFLYISGKNITLNGEVFKDYDSIKNQIKKDKIKKIRVFGYIRKNKNKKLPEELRVEGVEYYKIPWTKSAKFGKIIL
jgi:hypothetical protein